MKEAQPESVRRRLEMLEQAEALGNVSQVCKEYGISRPMFYRYKKRYEKNGTEGLFDRAPVHKSHPMTISKDVKDKIVAVSLSNPAWGCDRISKHLKAKDISVSGPTIQRILTHNGLRTRRNRLFKLEEVVIERGHKLSAEQIAFIKEHDPSFRGRRPAPNRPGQLLSQDTFPVGEDKRQTRPIYLHAVVDVYCDYAFGYLGHSERAEGPITVFEDFALRFYDGQRLEVQKVIADSTIFRGPWGGVYKQNLRRHRINHEPKTHRLQDNGSIERFRKTVADEFFGQTLRESADVSALQRDLDEWLKWYNTDRPHEGYPNMGRSPKERIDEYLRGVRGGR